MRTWQNGVIVSVILLLPNACHQKLGVIPTKAFYPTPQVRLDQDTRRLFVGFAKQTAPMQAADKQLNEPEVYRLGVTNNARVLLAHAKLEKARKNALQSGLWANPELDSRVLSSLQGDLNVELGLRFVIPLAGRLAAAKQEALLRVDLAQLELFGARLQALVEVEKAVAELVDAKERLALFKNLANRSLRFAQLVKSRRVAAMADPLDVALVLADATRDRRAVENQRNRVVRLSDKLALLIGLPPVETHFVLRSELEVLPKLSPQKLQTLAEKKNVTILRTRLELEVADAQATLVAKKRVPDLKIGPAFTLEEGQPALGATLGLELPLFNTSSAAYEHALANRNVAFEKHQQALRETVARVRSKATRLNSLLRQRKQLLGEAYQVLSQALALAEVRFTAGKLDVLKLLSVQRAYAGIKLDTLDLALAINHVQSELKSLVGGSLRVKGKLDEKK